MPADQSAPEREERLVNVGSLLVSHAQAAKLIQPRERALHDPPPLAQATPMLRAAHGEQRKNVASSQALTYGLCVIRAVAENAFRTAPRPPSIALERGNRIDEWQRFFRVVPVAPVKRTASGTPWPSQIIRAKYAATNIE
jgi:hypothetical protein